MKSNRTQQLPRGLGSQFCRVAFAFLVATAAADAQEPAGETGPTNELAEQKANDAAVAALIARCEASVVAITREPPAPAARGARVLTPNRDPFGAFRGFSPAQQSKEPSGAGVIFDSDGLIVTQYLVVKPGDRHTVTTVDGNSYPAQIQAADPRSGLAVLSIKAEGLSALTIGNAEDLRKGSSVATISNPYAVLSDGQPTACFGRVTNLARKAGPQVNLNNTKDDRRNDYRTTLHHFGSLIQVDARLGWNAHGGALVNLDGQLVGITTTVSTIAGHEQPAGYAIPFNRVFRRVLEELKEGREVEYGLLGVSFSAELAPTSQARPPGIVVQQAYAGGPAGRAGLRPQDIITKIGGEPVPDADRLQLVVGSQPPGSQLTVEYERNGRVQETEVQLGKYFAYGEKVITNRAARWRGIRVDYSTAVNAETLAMASQRGLIDPDGCVVIADVDPESVSWKQGVRPGMFLSHLNGARVTTPKEFWNVANEIASKGADSAVNLRFTQPLAAPGTDNPTPAPRRPR